MAKPIANPYIELTNVSDQYAQKNFENLDKYFKSQNQLLDFKFFELSFTAAQTAYKVAHGLGYIPLDILTTKVTGTGKVTFKHGSFDSTNIVMDVSGPCRIRFFAGTYSQQQTSIANASADTEEKTASVPTPNSAAVLVAGMMMFWPSSTAPAGWLLYTDAPLSQATYPALYALFGRSFSQGGDDATTFRLPPGLGRVPVIAGAGSGLTSRAMGATGGEETHQLTQAEMPAHTHTDSGHSHTIPTYGNVPAVNNNVATSSDVFRNSTGGPTNAASANIQSTGGDGAHNNMQPFVAWYAIIKT
jgi:microcystin-dependent protein